MRSYQPLCHFVQMQTHDHWVLGFLPFRQVSLAPVHYHLQKANGNHPTLSSTHIGLLSLPPLPTLFSSPPPFLPCSPCMGSFLCLENSSTGQHQLFHQVWAETPLPQRCFSCHSLKCQSWEWQSQLLSTWASPWDAWTLSKHGGQVPSVSVPEEPWCCMALSDLASKVTKHHFCCSYS